MILSPLSAMLLASLPTALAKPAFGATLVPRSLQARAANVSCGADPRMPPDSWDSHLHVMEPERYPVNPENPYTPGVHTVWDNAIFESSIGCEHVVFVQSTTHGLDMSLMLDSLQAYGTDRARGIALFDHDNVTESQLKSWHEAGVRGVRVNLVTYADLVDEEALVKELQAYADIIRSFDWVLQLYVKMETIPLIEDILPKLNVKIVFDHHGDPILPEKTNKAVDPYEIKGFKSLARLLKKGTIYVKISGSYRFTKLENSTTYDDVDPITLEILRLGPERTVFGSDWPHTRFDGLNIKPWVNHLLDLTEGDPKLRQRLFRDNARTLWGVSDSGDGGSCK